MIIFFNILLWLNNVLITKTQGMTYPLYKGNGSWPSALRNLESEVVQGGSDTLNYYYTYLYIGNPPQRQSYIIDTGSQITTSPCEPYCKNCGKHENKPFKISNGTEPLNCSSASCKLVSSSCNNNQQCSFSISYSEGSSLNGLYFDEMISITPNGKRTLFPIGCTAKETHLFLTQLADGIMGLSNSNKTITSILSNEKIIKHNLFSLCFSQTGGYFSMGEINSTLHLKDDKIDYIPLDSSSFYSVNLTSITINSQKIDVTNGAIIDSGTTIAYFPSKLAKSIEENIIESCKEKNCGKFSFNSDYGQCLDYNNIEEMLEGINHLPIMTFTFANGVNYLWSPYDYVFNNTNVEQKKFQICLGYTSTSSGRINLGSTWMHNHDIIFDKDNKKIGMIRANCDNNSPNTITESTEDPIKDNNTSVSNNIETKNPEDKIPVEDNSITNNTIMSEPGCIEINQETRLIIYCAITSIMIIIIIFLSIAICYIRRGKNFLCIKMALGTETRAVQFDKVVEEITNF